MPSPRRPFQSFLQQALLQNLSVPAGAPAPLNALAPDAAAAQYSRSLQSAAEVMTHANEPATNHAREKLGKEFSAWLHVLPPGYATDLQGAGPEDLLVFMDYQWLPRHAGSKLPGFEAPVASPQGVACALSHMSTLFKRIGRIGAYNDATGSGNPCESPIILLYKQGYRRKLWEAGYQESSAVPMTEPKLHQLILHLDDLIRGESNQMVQLGYARDIVMLLYSWDSSMRGKEGGKLCLPDLHDASQQQLFPDPAGYQVSLAQPSEIWIRPTHGTKVNKQGRNKQDPVRLVAGPNPCFCVVSRMWKYLKCCKVAKQPISHYLLRPFTSNKRGFKEKPYSSSSFGKRVKQLALTLGIYNGETGHSFRRGSLQHTHSVDGVLAAAEQGRIKTPAILARYLDPGRHQGRPGFHS